MARLPDPETSAIEVDLKDTTEESYKSMQQIFYSLMKGSVGNAEMQKRKEKSKDD